MLAYSLFSLSLSVRLLLVYLFKNTLIDASAAGLDLKRSAISPAALVAKSPAHASHRDHVLAELISTEKDYLADLDVMEEVRNLAINNIYIGEVSFATSPPCSFEHVCISFYVGRVARYWELP